MTRYFPEAEVELNAAAQFYEDRQSGLGHDFLSAIEGAIQSIELAPRRWPVVRGPIRRCLVSKYPYSILYADYHDEIVVIAIAHLSRNPSYWLSRLEGNFGS